jgi:uncharacterized repeat protein (TIGR03803 family)
MRGLTGILLGAALASLAVTAASNGGNAAATVTSLYKFKGSGANDGSEPVGWLIQDQAGNLYGTTAFGGIPFREDGTVFMLSPPEPPKTHWTRTNLHIFAGQPTDGSRPSSGLFADKEGRLYGVTELGGKSGKGSVFRLTPPAAADQRAKKWTYELLYSFAGDGRFPTAGVVVDANGIVYGSTSRGGAHNKGVLFSLTPASGPPWTYKTLYAFTGMPDGDTPHGRLSIDQNGVLLATTSRGGKFDQGMVFRFTPPAGSAAAKPVVLYSFKNNGADGANPGFGGLVTDTDGAIYGTTFFGGGSDEGTVFKLTPTTPAATKFTESLLYQFAGGTDGHIINYGLVAGKGGRLLGTSAEGGSDAGGSLFKLVPPADGQTAWTKRVIHDFQLSGPEGTNPSSDLLIGKGNVIYGATLEGGDATCHCGTVFMITE